MVALTAAFILAMFEPGYLDGLLIGQLEGMRIDLGVSLLALFFWLVPLFMMYLSLVLSRPLLRWLNIILGFLLGLLNLFDFVGQFSSIDAARVARAITVALMALIPFLIARQGWKLSPETI